MEYDVGRIRLEKGRSLLDLSLPVPVEENIVSCYLGIAPNEASMLSVGCLHYVPTVTYAGQLTCIFYLLYLVI